AMCPGLAPLLLPPNWLRSPVSKSALKRISADAGPSEERAPDNKKTDTNHPRPVIGFIGDLLSESSGESVRFVRCRNPTRRGRIATAHGGDPPVRHVLFAFHIRD